ncbi:hypothetical protein ACFVYT_41785 [Streptomyces sp. NPDC058290]|uniref:hypothetical protein n=1 Tax=unclassified Streptomyces TaxID=2593676 RepID=UPI0036E1013C
MDRDRPCPLSGLQIRLHAGAAKEKKAAVKEQAAEKTALVADQIQHAAQLVKDTTPDPILHKAGQVATVARANRKPLLVAGVALLVLLMVRRSRRSR